jgi:protein MpaA
MNILECTKTKLGNKIELIGESGDNNILIIGVFHGDEPQGKHLIEEYLNPTSEYKIPVLPQGEDIDLVQLSKNLRNNMTKEEVILWQHIRNRQISNTKFRRQQPIGKYICDFVSFDKKIIIEIDGSQHLDSDNDKTRDKNLTSQGFTVLRFWNNEINNNLNEVLNKIKQTIDSCPPFMGGPKSLISRGGNNLIFIPCLNPDGMDANNRTNANGVDLNRNFPTKNWGKNEGENATCDDCTTAYFGGKSPASEIETQFVINIIEKYSPKLILTIHAPYKVVNYDGPAKEIAEKISNIIDYPAEGSIGYPTPGSFGTYCGIERNIPTITLELDEQAPLKNIYPKMFEIFEELKHFK